MKRISAKNIRECKGQRKLAAVTAYDVIVATLADQADMDILLVGDSVGMVHMGFEATTEVTPAMIVHHTRAVANARPKALVVADMAFPGVAQNFDLLLAQAVDLLRAGADAVKVEGGVAAADKIAALVQAGIPVMGHIGLLPQQIHQLGAYRKMGKAEAEAAALQADAEALVQAGVFSMVLELVAAPVAQAITQAVAVPTIGIGSGSDCDGQILVSTDLLGMTVGPVPPFAKAYADLKTTMSEALQEYAKDVRGEKA